MSVRVKAEVGVGGGLIGCHRQQDRASVRIGVRLREEFRGRAKLRIKLSVGVNSVNVSVLLREGQVNNR